GVHVAVVVVGIGREGQPLGAGGLDRVAVAGAGEEAHAVPGCHEVAGDGEQRRDVPVDGRRADEQGERGGGGGGGHGGGPVEVEGHEMMVNNLLEYSPPC